MVKRKLQDGNKKIISAFNTFNVVIHKPKGPRIKNLS